MIIENNILRKVNNIDIMSNGIFTIPDEVKIIGKDAFRDCDLIKKIIIHKDVLHIHDFAFYNCASLEAITIPNEVNYIGEMAFFNCIALKEIILPKNLQHISYGMFAGCKSLEHIIIQDGVISINDIAFWDCCSLNEIVIPESVIDIGNFAFSWCQSLKMIIMPDHLQLSSIWFNEKTNPKCLLSQSGKTYKVEDIWMYY